MAEPGTGGPVRAAALFRLADLLEAEGVVYTIVGALAVAVWGRPRATADVDVTLFRPWYPPRGTPETT